MFKTTALLAVLSLAAAGAHAAETRDEPPPCGETDFVCIQQRETQRFTDQIDSQKEVWLQQWAEAKKRGIAMMKKHKLNCGELSRMERMKCRVEAVKKLKEWKEKHQAKKDEYLERIKTLKANFLEKQNGEDGLWAKVKDDYSQKARGIKDQLLRSDTVQSFLGPVVAGGSLESQVNAALQRGSGSVAGAVNFAQERAAHFEKLTSDRAACRSVARVSACLQQVGSDHDQWAQEFELRKAQAQEVVSTLPLPTGN
ncbi:MAG: hypothetical protein COB53_12880 [Elusimicrobia bacterium]|nr:MAG: hypothetical protein COB53_12880 [Elusimicrobiota bacterium]